jgi:hypothetical protein
LAADEEISRSHARLTLDASGLCEVDFGTREGRLFLDGDSKPERFVFDGGAWRLSPDPLD